MEADAVLETCSFKNA